jgi:TonB-linked SusC/RagA family outer membrane protein
MVMRIIFTSTKVIPGMLLAIFFPIAAECFGQEVNITGKNMRIEKVFSTIKQQTGYTFAYSEATIAAAKTVNMDIREGTLEDALRECFQNQRFTYSIIEKTIVIKPREDSAVRRGGTSAPMKAAIEIQGRVTDSLGNPLARVSVTLRGSGRGTVTDENGNFTISVDDGSAVLSFSIIGYETKEMVVGEQRSLSIVLSAASTSLEDIVVTGYQTRLRKMDATSIATVDIKSVSLQPMASFDQILQGQATGLNVKSGSGQPGRAADVVIRGRGSINGSTTPLYIIDGVQVEAADFAAMNPADFENVSILKDGASASLYGSRGANGVIVITTKKGRAGKMTVTYDGQFGYSKLPEGKMDLMNSQQKVDFEVNMADNPYGWTEPQADSLKRIDYDWRDAIYKTAPMQQHQLSLAGGNEKTKIFGSLSYMDQDGILINTGLKRYTGRFNIDHTVNHFRIGANIAGGYTKTHEISEGNQNTFNPLNNFIWALPYEVPFTATGAYTESIQGISTWTNPVEDVTENVGHRHFLKAYGNAFVEYNFPQVEGLSWRTNVGGDYGQREYFDIIANGTQSAIQGGMNIGPQYGNGDLRQGLTKLFRSTITNYLSYKRRFGTAAQHNLSAAVYHETVRTRAEGFGYRGFGLLNPFRNAAGLVAGTTTNGFIPEIENIIYSPDNGIVSFFAIADYTYLNKFIFGGSVRRDGSSRLAKENRWVTYGGISGAYILSEENFIKNIAPVSFLKVKASYGTVGNQEGIGDFPYLQNYSSGTFAGGSSLGLASFGNRNLKWETRSTFNTGIEFALFNNRITAGLEFYNSITKNLFFNLTTPSTSGGPGSVLGNAGSMRNRGIEANLDLAVIRSKHFNWNIIANYSVNRNTVLSLPEGQDFQLYRSYQILQVGKPLNSFYLVPFLGVDPETGRAIYLKKDGKTMTNDYDPNDRVTMSTSDAPFNGGITNNLRFKNLSLSFFWVFSYGNHLYNYALTNIEYPGYAMAGFSARAMNAWTTPGQITNFPSLNDPFEDKTTRYLENDRFWRLRNVIVSYNLPVRWCSKLGIASARLFAQGQNLATIYDVLALDPEISTINSNLDENSSADITGAQYPPLKSVTFGLSVSF